MPIINAKVLDLHWNEIDTSCTEATLEVEHSNGDRQYFVIDIVRMSNRIPKARVMKKDNRPDKDWTDEKKR